MNIEQLEYIVEVAKAGSLSVASQKLHVTQSAISQSIAHLESELGVKIFTRSRSGATPTDVGTRLIQKALETLVKLQEFRDEANQLSHLVAGELRIGTVPGPMMFLPGTLSAYKNDYPNVQIAITEKGSQDIMDDLKQERIDIGLIGLTKGLMEITDKVDMEVVLRGRMIAAISKNSPLAFAPAITPEDIRRHPLVLYDDDRVREFIHDFSGKHGPVSILFSTNNLDAIRNAVQENLAITIGFDYTIRHDPYIMNGQGVPVAIEGYDQEDSCLALVWRKSAQNTPAMSSFISRFKSQLQSI